MSSYAVDSDAVGSAEAMVRATSERIQQDVAAMMSQLLALQDVWRGSASAAFQSVINDWRGTQTRVDSSLANIAVGMRSASTQYADVETANTQLFAV